MSIHRYNWCDLSADDRTAIIDLISGRGLADPANVAVNFALVEVEDGWQLHLSEFQCNESGSVRLDVAADRPVTRPVVLDVDLADLPDAIRLAAQPPTESACPGPLIWFAVPKRGEDVEESGILECASCGYVVMSGSFNDTSHAYTPVMREGIA